MVRRLGWVVRGFLDLLIRLAEAALHTPLHVRDLFTPARNQTLPEWDGTEGESLTAKELRQAADIPTCRDLQLQWFECRCEDSLQLRVLLVLGNHRDIAGGKPCLFEHPVEVDFRKAQPEISIELAGLFEIVGQ